MVIFVSVRRLQLQGLLPDAEYEVNEHVPNNVSQRNLAIVETEGQFNGVALRNYYNDM